MMQNLKILPATPQDAEEIAEIEKSCFSSQAWSQSMVRQTILNENSYFICAKISDQVVGYGGMYSAGPEGYVYNIAVKQQFRNMGLGTKLLCGLTEHSKVLGLEFLSLEVRRSNLAAVKLYEKLGFENLGLRKNFYEMPKEDEIIMTKYLVKNPKDNY